MIPENDCKLLITEAIDRIQELNRLNDLLQVSSKHFLDYEYIDTEGVERLKLLMEMNCSWFQACSEVIETNLAKLLKLSEFYPPITEKYRQ